jgi:PAS domain S-box-containing protein
VSTPIRESPTAHDYVVALVTIAIAILVRGLMTPLMGTNFPLATMFSAVAFSAWYSGWRPALFTAVGGFLAADAAFIPGSRMLGGRPLVPELFSIGVYLLSCGSIIVLGEAMRAAQRRLETGQRALSNANHALEQRVEAHALLAAIVASTGDCIISTTLGGTITSWNAGAEQLFDYSSAEALGRGMGMLVPPDRSGEQQGIIDRIQAGGRVDHLDTVRLTKSGVLRDVSLTVSPVHDRHGLLIGTSTVARDNTLRKSAERQLLRSEEEQRLLVAIHDATRGLHDAGDVMREAATQVVRHFAAAHCAYGEVDLDASTMQITGGYSRDLPTLAGRYPLGGFGDGMIAALRAGRTAAIEDVRTSPLADTRLAARTYAQMRVVSLLCVPLLRADRLTAILLMADTRSRSWTTEEADLLAQIAERTLFAVESARGAAALRESRDVLALAMGAGRMGAWSQDVETNSVWWSPELEEIAGLPPGGFEGSEEGFYALVHEEDRPALARAVDTALQSGTDYKVEFRYRHGSGQWRWMEGRGMGVYGRDGAPRMIYGLGIDITDRRRTVEALQEADRRKDEFLATLAHELRNPLAPITSGLHILRVTGGHGEQAEQARDIMERQVAQMVRLVDDLLDVARISTGKIELRREPMDLADAVRDAVDTSRPLVTAGGQTLEVSLPSTPVFVNADRTRLSQMFANLLNNSAKFSAPHQPIAITVERDGDEGVVRVRDAGMGIHPENLPGIFDMFRQAGLADGRSRGGLGIGLFLVKRMAEMHGGRVEAQSDGPGLGSEFVVRLPVLQGLAPAPLRTLNGNAAGLAAPRRILVVDDNQDAASLLATMLAIHGHETRLAHDGPEAMAVAGDYRPDVVVLDIGLPTVDGHETARWIRRQPWGRHILLVAVTGWGHPEERRRSNEAGFDHHLVKPADPLAIADLISAPQVRPSSEG